MPGSAVLRRRLAQVAPVGGGTLLLGVSAYVVLGFAGHQLSPRDYTAVASLYLIAAITGPGVFIALEQETNREVSSRRAGGVGTRPVRRGAAYVGAGMALLVGAVLLGLSPLLVPGVLGGSWALLVASLVAMVGAAAVYLLRGVFAGERRFGWYATSLAAEGLARIVPCLLLVLIGTASATAFGFAFAVGTGLAALLCLPGLGAAAPGPAASVQRMSRSAFVLAFASGLTFVVANVAPLVLTARLPDEPELAASFVSLFVLARVPVFLFTPLQAFLLPGLAAGVEQADARLLRSRMGSAMLVVAAFGLPVAGLTAALGPWAARAFFDAPLDLPHLAAFVLGISTVAMMAAQALQPALVALGIHRMATAAWILGTACFGGLLFLPGDPVTAAVTAQLVGPVVVVVLMAAAFLRAVRKLEPRAAAAAPQ